MILRDFISAHLHCRRFDTGTAHQKRYTDVKLEREAFALDQPELAEMVAVVGRVDDVRVVQLAECLQLLVDTLDRHVHALQRLEPLGHQQIGELAVDRFHLLRYSQDPLLVRVRGMVYFEFMISPPHSRHPGGMYDPLYLFRYFPKYPVR
uniref:Uncharacterized protein n=1 Tax=Anopheles coluzzii TaxID=1518534 RepID=A0A8W7P9T3_ANOCL